MRSFMRCMEDPESMCAVLSLACSLLCKDTHSTLGIDGHALFIPVIGGVLEKNMKIYQEHANNPARAVQCGALTPWRKCIFTPIALDVTTQLLRFLKLNRVAAASSRREQMAVDVPGQFYLAMSEGRDGVASTSSLYTEDSVGFSYLYSQCP